MSSSCSPEYASGFKLFGVQIDLAESNICSIRKSKSLGNILEATLSINDPDSDIIKKSRSLDNLQTAYNIDASDYVSDGLLHQSISKGHDIRKRGKPWTEEEHRSFLMGLEKLGRGDWKGISSKFVPSRNSTQVASHAQKYFMRLANKEKKRRRSSVFDIPLVNSKHKEPIRAIQGSSSNTSPEVRNLAASSKNDGEMKGKTILASSEKPPLSPMKRNIIPEFHNPTYASRLSSFNQGFASQGTRPTLSWVPVINFSGRNSFLVTNFHGGLANCGAFVPQSSVGFQKMQHMGSSQVRSGAETPSSDDLNHNIRNLTL